PARLGRTLGGDRGVRGQRTPLHLEAPEQGNRQAQRVASSPTGGRAALLGQVDDWRVGSTIGSRRSVSRGTTQGPASAPVTWSQPPTRPTKSLSTVTSSRTWA